MREQLIQYVQLLFAGVAYAEEMQEEILLNTLDRYDDLIAQGKSPQAAYRLAISGIGDISELLGTAPVKKASSSPPPVSSPSAGEERKHRRFRAIAIAMYILSPIPLFLLDEFGSDTLGLCFTLALVAAATYILFLHKKDDVPEEPRKETPHEALKRSVGSVVWALITAVYLLLSFFTLAWHITWLLFPIGGSIQGLINAILDLKEAKKHES